LFCYYKIVSILLVEDHPKLAQNVVAYLEHEKFVVVHASDGKRGLTLASEPECELVLLDLNLPKLDGLELCRRLREAGEEKPVMMLTARSTTSDIVVGLAEGADDYLAKPFALPELLARVQALMRRSPRARRIIKVGDVTLDLDQHSIHRDGQRVELAPKEYSLLAYLAEHRGIAQERTEILEEVWGEAPDLLFSQTVDVHVAYVRRKLGRDVIKTVPGKGYLVV
jgi:DNA-binding response OmpR family regulator